jgi:monomeric sarcosine oxidase
MSKSVYDAIVLGAGGVGSAALWHLAARGLKVLGIDRFAPPHERGSSHGHTRIIRQAYFEHPDYVPLVLESYRLWRELEQTVGKSLLLETGLVEIGPNDGIVVPGTLRAAHEHALPVETLSARDIERRWPAMRVPEALAGVYDGRAGLLRVEECVAASLKAAGEADAELLSSVEVHGWSAHGDLRVQTSAGEYCTARLIVTAGAWAGELLGELNLKLEVRRKTLMWHACDEPKARADAGMPCYLFELPHGVFYGFPVIDSRGLKAAEHSGGDLVADPLNVDRSVRDTDRAPVEAFLQAHIPSAQTPSTAHAVCLYTMSPDEHFIVDRHPADDRIVFAAGLSGHGFKFTPVLGKTLADLAIDGATKLPIDFLSLGRFSK